MWRNVKGVSNVGGPLKLQMAMSKHDRCRSGARRLVGQPKNRLSLTKSKKKRCTAKNPVEKSKPVSRYQGGIPISCNCCALRRTGTQLRCLIPPCLFRYVLMKWLFNPSETVLSRPRRNEVVAIWMRGVEVEPCSCWGVLRQQGDDLGFGGVRATMRLESQPLFCRVMFAWGDRRHTPSTFHCLFILCLAAEWLYKCHFTSFIFAFRKRPSNWRSACSTFSPSSALLCLEYTPILRLFFHARWYLNFRIAFQLQAF